MLLVFWIPFISADFSKNTRDILRANILIYSVNNKLLTKLKKAKKKGSTLCYLFRCEKRDLNPYGVYHTPLKRARLPVPPLSRILGCVPHNIDYYTLFFSFVKCFLKKTLKNFYYFFRGKLVIEMYIFTARSVRYIFADGPCKIIILIIRN